MSQIVKLSYLGGNQESTALHLKTFHCMWSPAQAQNLGRWWSLFLLLVVELATLILSGSTSVIKLDHFILLRMKNPISKALQKILFC